ncbi:MAG: hypothetical protein ABI824_18025 [Acidobacteriota bacterium]
MLNAVEFLGSQLLGFGLGVIASVIASFLYDRWRRRRARQDYGSLEGVWVEANGLLQDRPFSVCEFYFGGDGDLKFRGFSYDNDAREFYEWWSIVLHIDDRQRRMSYIYETRRVGQTTKDEGFGCNFLRLGDDGRWSIFGGYFLDLGEARPRHITMRRFEDVTKFLKMQLDPNLKEDRRLLVGELLQRQEDDSVRAFLS